MSLIPLKKVTRTQNGASKDFYTVPAVVITTAQGKKLIPNPSGTETATFQTKEEAIEAIRRAGLDYTFEGVPYSTSKQTSTTQNTTPLSELPLDATSEALSRAIPILTQRLMDRESSVVAQSAFALGELQAQSAIEALIRLLGHEENQVRKEAAEALAKMGGPAIQPLLSAFRQAKSSSENNAIYIRLSVMTAYQYLIQSHRELLCLVIAQAVEALEDASWIVRSQAASFIGEAAPHLMNNPAKE